MSDHIDDPRVEWAKLRLGAKLPDSSGIPTRRSSLAVENDVVRFALDGHGNPRVLFPLSPSEKVPDVEIGPTLQLGEISMTEQDSPGGSRRYLEVNCCERALERVFSDVVCEVMRRIKTGTSCSAACLDTATEFARLFQRNESGTIGSRLIKGLIGEMLFLRALLETNGSAWRLWHGGVGNRNDFRHGEHGIEVKTSEQGSNKVSISSVRQLHCPPGGSLHLVQYQLDSTENGALSIGSLVETCAGIADNPLGLRKRLAESGCTDPESPEWNRETFELHDMRMWKVDERFPCIVPDSFVGFEIPKGIYGLSYAIDLSMAERSRLESDDATIEIQSFAKRLPQ